MKMSFESLPVIIVTAHTTDAANEFIKELIDKDVTEEMSPAGAASQSADRVWRLHNKYYTCEVRVRAAAAAGAEPARAPDEPEAHLVYLADDETDEGALSALLSSVRGAAVRVVAGRWARVPGPVRALCAAARADPVPLREHPADGETEPCGIACVRAALHAHAWPGARARVRAAAAAPAADAVERAERFAAALGALGGGAEHVRALPPEERRAAAERLVAAFAAALPDTLDSDTEPEPEPER